MIAASSDIPDDEPAWNVEGEDLAFLRDEGLELLHLYRSIRDPKKRQLVMDLVRTLAGEPRR